MEQQSETLELLVNTVARFVREELDFPPSRRSKRPMIFQLIS